MRKTHKQSDLNSSSPIFRAVFVFPEAVFAFGLRPLDRADPQTRAGGVPCGLWPLRGGSGTLSERRATEGTGDGGRKWCLQR
jgi:hypothetical protein